MVVVIVKMTEKTKTVNAIQRVKCVARQSQQKLILARVHLVLAQIAVQSRRTNLPQEKVVRKAICLHQKTVCGLSFLFGNFCLL